MVVQIMVPFWGTLNITCRTPTWFGESGFRVWGEEASGGGPFRLQGVLEGSWGLVRNPRVPLKGSFKGSISVLQGGV